MDSKRDLILKLAWAQGMVRPKDLQPFDIAPAYLQRLAERGELHRVGRGVYMLPTTQISEHHSLAEVAKRFPRGLICLLSALRFHELGTETPNQVWLALPKEAPTPRASDLNLRVVRYAPLAMTAGIEHHRIEGVEVPLTSKVRTIVDCFRFRNRIGIGTALEALQAGLHQGIRPVELRQVSKQFRQANVIRPYLEALL
jgi:predicted transcriptional regulator of viral defense system